MSSPGCSSGCPISLARLQNGRNRPEQASPRLGSAGSNEGHSPIKADVRARYPELVDAAAHATGEDQKSARNKLKSYYLQEVQTSTAAPATLFANFYPIVAKI